MALPAKITKLTDVGEAFRGEYVALPDGKEGFILDVTKVEGFAMEDVSGLRSALTKEKDERDKAKTGLRPFADLAKEHDTDVTGLRTLIDQKFAAANGVDKTVDEQVQAQLTIERDRHKAEVAKLTGEKNTLNTSLEKSTVDSAISTALAQFRASPDLLGPVLRDKIKAVRLEDGRIVARPVDESGRARLTEKAGETGDMSVGEFIETLKSNPTYKPAFPGKGVSGTGTSPAGSGGPAGDKLDSIPMDDPASRIDAARKMSAAGKK